jgi:ribosomal protein S18 acetylase RimI-like enzyme
VRPATAADVPAIERIVDRAYAPYVERIGRRPAPMDADYTALVEHTRVLVDGDDVVGLIVVLDEADHVFVENVAVDPSATGRGYGRMLLGYAESRARELGLPQVRLYTNAAMTENLAMYPRLGYVETDRRSEDGFDRVYFAKGV